MLESVTNCIKRQSRAIVSCLYCLMLCSASLEAGTGEIHASAFKYSGVIVYANTVEVNHKMTALVIKTGDWYSGISGEGSVEVDSKVINLYLESSHYYENSYQLLQKAQKVKFEKAQMEKNTKKGQE